MQECSLLTSDAEESDNRVWLHVVRYAGTRKLLFSPGTDVYHIGLPLSFAGIGKATIMRNFLENAWFITGTQDIPGTLADTNPGRVEEGFMSFIRLVGTILLRNIWHSSLNTPRALYMSLTE